LFPQKPKKRKKKCSSKAQSFAKFLVAVKAIFDSFCTSLLYRYHFHNTQFIIHNSKFNINNPTFLTFLTSLTSHFFTSYFFNISYVSPAYFFINYFSNLTKRLIYIIKILFINPRYSNTS
jgi:hypothetical protein